MTERNSLVCCVAIATSALLTAGSDAQAADGEVFRSHCNLVGPHAADNVGDRPGHKITVAQSVCEVSGGVMEGGIMTAATIYEWDNMKATLLAGTGVLRKEGMVVVYKHTQGDTVLTNDGKVTRASAVGKGVIAFASGPAAYLSGKTYTFSIVTPDTGKPYFEVKMD
jgi:hypothetical protein